MPTNLDHFILAPGFTTLCREKIAELEVEILACKGSIERAYRQKVGAPADKLWEYEWLIAYKRDSIVGYEREIRRFSYLKLKSSGKVLKGAFDVEQIKTIPCGDLIPTKRTYDSKSQSKFLCPLHDDSTASLVWYKAQNRWWCFGCNQGSSVIDLQMKLANQDFTTACRTLST